MKKKVSVVFGTRPEAVKLAPVVEALREKKGLITKIIATAQHRELLDQMLGAFELNPDYDLDLMKPGQSLDDVTSKVLVEVGKLFDELKPDLVLVQGDTTTVLSASLAAFYRKIPTGHVEAGLRSGNLHSPFPEEVNRIMAGRLASLHFAPTKLAAENLVKEGVKKENIFVTGNTVIDAIKKIMERTEERGFDFLDGHEKIVLVTAHRRESFGPPMKRIFSAIKKAAEERSDFKFVFPVHPNPEVRSAVEEVFGKSAANNETSNNKISGKKENVILIPPLEYIPFVHLMKRSYIILTDSGGIQEEATALGKPVLILREVTERPEAVMAGAAKLVGNDEDRIVESLRDLMDGGKAYEDMARPRNVFGDGKAGERIADICMDYFHNIEK